MLNKIPNPTLKYPLALFLTMCLFIPTSRAQLIDHVLENFGKYANVSYTATLQNKDLFSDEVFLDTLYATEFLGARPSFRLKGNVQEDIYDGNKVFKLNHKDSTYRIADRAKDSYYFDKSLAHLMAQLKKYVQKGKKAIQLKDSSYQGKSYFQFQVTDLDSLVKGKKVYSINKFLIDKKTYMPHFYRNDSEGFIDGTDMFLKIFNEYHFSDFQVNHNHLTDLSQVILPTYFNLEKPKVPMALLEKGTQAPALPIVDLQGKVTEIAAYKGKVVLLNFTINGCPHCIESMGMLNALSKAYKATDFVILSINPLDDRESILKYNEQFKQEYPTFTSAKTTKQIYRINGYPTFYLLNAKGEIVNGYLGFAKHIEEQVSEEVATLLQQK